MADKRLPGCPEVPGSRAGDDAQLERASSRRRGPGLAWQWFHTDEASPLRPLRWRGSGIHTSDLVPAAPRSLPIPCLESRGPFCGCDVRGKMQLRTGEGGRVAREGSPREQRQRPGQARLGVVSPTPQKVTPSNLPMQPCLEIGSLLI